MMVKLCPRGEPREANGAGYSCGGCKFSMREELEFTDEDGNLDVLIWCDWDGWFNDCLRRKVI